MLSEREERVLAFIMQWCDTHIDDKGIRQSPSRFLVSQQGFIASTDSLRRKGYVRYQGSNTIMATPRAERWWMERKSGFHMERKFTR